MDEKQKDAFQQYINKINHDDIGNILETISEIAAGNNKLSPETLRQAVKARLLQDANLELSDTNYEQLIQVLSAIKDDKSLKQLSNIFDSVK